MKLRIIIFSVFFTILAIVLTLFIRTSVYIVYDTVTDYLQETAQLYAGTFKVKFTDELSVLETQARSFSDLDMTDSAAVARRAAASEAGGEFKSFALSASDGRAFSADGAELPSVSERDFFRSSMRGSSFISAEDTIDSDGERVLTLSVPVKSRGASSAKEASGVVFAFLPCSILNKIFSVDTFGGCGFSFLSDGTGKILVASENEKQLSAGDNWAEFLSQNGTLINASVSEILQNASGGSNVAFRFTLGGKQHVGVCAPLNLNGWYVLSGVTAKYINAQQARIMHLMIVVIGIIFITIMACGLLIGLLARKNRQIEKDNELFKTANETSQTFVFEFDIKKQMLFFSGCTDFIFGSNISSLSFSQFFRIEKRLHRAESGFLQDMAAFVAGNKQSFSKEVRLLRADSSFAWFRISGSRSEDGQKIVGKVVNVDDQVIREMELKEKADTDLLSGLLNKTAMQQRIKEKIAEGKDSFIGAFYIIDLDNFKQVNDCIGHSVGDAAICEAATKLKLVFSERDYIARIGGDEYCVFLMLRKNMMPNLAVSVITEKARTLCAILEEDYSDSKHTVHVTASIGVSLFPQQATSYKDLFKRADTALYAVKRNGKNAFAIYEENMKSGTETVYE